MGILTKSTNTTSRFQDKITSEEKQRTEFYANIGFYAEFTDPEGNCSMEFVSLPVNIGLDTIQPIKIGKPTGSTGQQRMIASNELLAKLQQACTTLEPGDSKDTKLSVQLFRTSERVDMPATQSSDQVQAILNDLI